MAEVPLVDLEVIVRYSLAIRQEVAPAEEVLAALDESRALVLALLEGRDANGHDEAPLDDQPEGIDEVAEPPETGDGLEDEVAAAEDQVALDDLEDSGADVDGTPGLDPEPPPPVEEDTVWVDEVERIRSRRLKKARREAEERQARQAALSEKAELAKRAKAAEEARRAQEPSDDPLELPTPLPADEAARRREQRRRRRTSGADPA